MRQASDSSDVVADQAMACATCAAEYAENTTTSNSFPLSSNSTNDEITDFRYFHLSLESVRRHLPKVLRCWLWEADGFRDNAEHEERGPGRQEEPAQDMDEEQLHGTRLS